MPDTPWPLVLPDDHGIRPAGPPDACFYCCAKVGSPHGRECVCALKRVRYDVLRNGVVCGTFERDEPYDWPPDQCEWHKNESSWCADNADIDWHETDAGRAAEKFDDEVDRDPHDAWPDGECLCGHVQFRFAEVVNPGPFPEPPHRPEPVEPSLNQ